MIRKMVSTILIVFCLCAVFAVDRYPVATLTLSLGEVKALIKGEKNWVSTKKGMVFYEGDKLKTSVNGKAEIFFYTGSKVRIANETEIEFTKDDKKKAKSIFLHVGEVWNKIRRGDKFEVETVHGVASVKGTEFDIKNLGDEMDVWVAEGLVEIGNENGSVLAERNTHTNLSKDSAPEKKRIRGSELPNWQKKMQAEVLVKVTSPGRKTAGTPFKLNITVKDAKTQKVFREQIEAVIETTSKGLELAMDQGAAEWTQRQEVSIVDGRATFWARKLTSGGGDISISGEKFSGIVINVKVKDTIKKRKVSLKYIGDDNKEHEIKLQYKIK